MINIDTRLLDSVSVDQLGLLCHIVKRAGILPSFPSNETLCKDTGWEIKKLQKVKKQLVLKGLLQIKPRVIERRQGSNFYLINSDFISVFVPAKNLQIELETDGIPKTGMYNTSEKGHGGGTPKSNNEVLSNSEVLFPQSDDCVPQTEDTNLQKPLFSDAEQNKSQSKKEKKEPDPFYVPFVKSWRDRYPDLGFNAVSGAKIKSIIAKTRQYVKNSGKEETVDHCNGMFQYVLDYVRRENHFCHFKPITTWDSQYLSIIAEIKNGKSTTKKPSARDYINSL